LGREGCETEVNVMGPVGVQVPIEAQWDFRDDYRGHGGLGSSQATAHAVVETRLDWDTERERLFGGH